VLNGPGVNVPCLSISRFPYPEYHTTDDNLDIMHEEKLQEAADVIEQIIRIYALITCQSANSADLCFYWIWLVCGLAGQLEV